MREVNIRQFNREMFNELLDLPFIITRYGMPLAKVTEVTEEDLNTDRAISDRLEKIDKRLADLEEKAYSYV